MSNLTVQELRDLGNKKFRELKYGVALMRYTQAIEKEPENYALYYNRSVTLVKMDEIDEAKEDLLTSLKLNPEYIPSLCQLGFIYLYNGDIPSSLETYVRVLQANEKLPHSLNRFKAQLKQAISLAESRALQQEYPQSFIDEILTTDIRSILDSYPTLPNHMIESGIPPVSFGNVPVSHNHEHASIIASASIPIPIRQNNNNQPDGLNGFNLGSLLSNIAGIQPLNANVIRTPASPISQTLPASTEAAAAGSPATRQPPHPIIRTIQVPDGSSTSGNTGRTTTVTTTTSAVDSSNIAQTNDDIWNVHRAALARAAELRSQANARLQTQTQNVIPPEVTESNSASATEDESGRNSASDGVSLPEADPTLSRTSTSIPVPRETHTSPEDNALPNTSPISTPVSTISHPILNAETTTTTTRTTTSSPHDVFSSGNLAALAGSVIGGLVSRAITAPRTTTYSSFNASNPPAPSDFPDSELEPFDLD